MRRIIRVAVRGEVAAVVGVESARMGRRWSVALAIVALLGLLIAGCGNKSSTQTTVAPSSYLLTSADVAQIAAGTTQPAAVAALLHFWQDIQYQNYAAAYLTVDPQLRAKIAYSRFVDGLARARGLFLVKPQVDAVQKTANLTTISLRLQRGKVLTQQDQIIGFNMRWVGTEWMIGTDPYNLFRVQTTR